MYKERLINAIRAKCGVSAPQPTDLQLRQIIGRISRINNPTLLDWRRIVQEICTGPFLQKEGLDLSDLNALLAMAKDELGNG